jgi:hypothetical protein
MRVTKLIPKEVPAAVYRMEVRDSGIHGRGVFAAQSIPPNRKVIEYTGERISAKHAEKRGHGERTWTAPSAAAARSTSTTAVSPI